MRKLIFATLLASIFPAVFGAPTEGDTVRLQMVHTTDVHGSFFPIDFISGTPAEGSMARVSTWVKQLRHAHPNGVVLLDGGDILQGRPLSYYFNYVATDAENVAASVVNYLRYDAQVYGNHDIETGHAVYRQWAQQVNCPMLGANIINSHSLLPYALPYTIVQRQGVKVAVLGMITPTISHWLAENLWSGLRFDEMVQCARHWVEFIRRNERPDLIVGVFHSGFEGGITDGEMCENATRSVAQQVDGFNVIFCGHDHKPHNAFTTSPSGREVLVLNGANNALAVAQASILMRYTGGKWTVEQRKGELVDVRNLDPDPHYMAHFAPQIEAVKQWANQPIGTLSRTIRSADCFFGNSAFGDLILNLTLRLHDADIAIGAPLQADATLHKGNITVGNMFSLYRFENNLYVLNLTGEELKGLLEMSYGLWVNTMKSPADHIMRMVDKGNGLWFEKPTYNFDSAIGIDYEVDVTKEEGRRIRILRMSNGEPFEPKKMYRVAMNSYRANGGGELLTRGAGIPKDELPYRVIYKSTTQMRTELMNLIKKTGNIDPKPANNWKFVPEKWTKPAIARDKKILFPK